MLAALRWPQSFLVSRLPAKPGPVLREFAHRSVAVRAKEDSNEDSQRLGTGLRRILVSCRNGNFVTGTEVFHAGEFRWNEWVRRQARLPRPGRRRESLWHDVERWSE